MFTINVRLGPRHPGICASHLTTFIVGIQITTGQECYARDGGRIASRLAFGHCIEPLPIVTEIRRLSDDVVVLDACVLNAYQILDVIVDA